MTSRIEQGVERGPQLELTIDGEQVVAWSGETLATVLLARDKSAFHVTGSGAPRAPFCNMGACFECRVQVAGRGWVLACMSPVENGMVVETGVQLPRIEVDDHAH